MGEVLLPGPSSPAARSSHRHPFPASPRSTGTVVENAVTWCTFHSRSCNFTAHGAVAYGATRAGAKLGLDPRIAATIAGGYFVYREIQQDRQWGDFWTYDSLMDLLSRVTGAVLAYHHINQNERVRLDVAPRAVTVSITVH